MKAGIALVIVIPFVAFGSYAAESVAEQFLRYSYGAGDVDIAKVSLPNDDLWMLPGGKNTNALRAIAALKLDPAKQDGIISGVIPHGQGQDLFFVELRNGKVDPAMNLDGVYQLHRQLVLMFLHAALSGDNARMARLTTEPKNVNVVGRTAARGDMDVYESVLAMMPVVRHSKPSDDAKSRTVSYRVPLSDDALALTLVKQGNIWKIDTSKKVQVPLEFFFR